MKKIIKWVSISVAGLLVLAVAFTAVFIAIPFARTMRNLSEKKDEPDFELIQRIPLLEEHHMAAASTCMCPTRTTAAQVTAW